LRYKVKQYALQLLYITMTSKKTTTLNLRVDPGIKEAIREAANRDHRSIANMIEILIRRHCEVVGITIPEQQGLFEDDAHG
jgi:hypothetical protein